MQRPKPVVPGGQLSATDLNNVFDVVYGLHALSVGEGLSLQQGGDGSTVIALDGDLTRLVKVTTNETIVTYPTDPATKTWPITFLPGLKFDPSAGPNSPQSIGPISTFSVAHNVKETPWIPDGTITVAHYINGRWWIDCAPRLLAKSNSAVAAGTPGTFRVYKSDTTTDTGVDITALNKWGAIDASAWVWLDWTQDAYVALSPQGGLGISLCKLCTTLTQGSYAEAIVYTWDGANWTDMGLPHIFIYDDAFLGPGLIGDFAVTILSPTSGRNEIISLRTNSSPLALLQLKYDLTQGGNQQAYSGVWDVGTSTWLPTGTLFTVYDSPNYGPVPAGKWVLCQLSSISARLEIISVPPGAGGTGLTLVEMYDAIDAGKSAIAVVCQWSGTAWLPTGAVVTVFDSGGEFGPLAIGARCSVQMSPDSGRLEIVAAPYGGHPARRVEFTAIQPMAKNEMETVVLATGFFQGVYAIDVPGEFVVQNTRNIFQLVAGNRGVAIYKSTPPGPGPDLDFYDIDWAECPGIVVSPGSSSLLIQPDTNSISVQSAVTQVENVISNISNFLPPESGYVGEPGGF